MSLLTGSANYIKYFLNGFNLVFMLTGIILIAVGVHVGNVFRNYDLFLVTKFFSIPTFLIVIGTFIIFFAFFGCWGALKENYCLLLIYSVLLGIIFILELSAGISGYVLRNEAENLIDRSLKEAITKYNTTKVDDVTILWDYVQRSFECCGIRNYTDWTQYPDKLPLSCCRIPYGIVGEFSCNRSILDTNRYSGGCLTTFSSDMAAHALILGALGIAIAVIQFFGALFAGYIAREIKIRNGITGIVG